MSKVETEEGFWDFEYDTSFDTNGIFQRGQIKGLTALI